MADPVTYDSALSVVKLTSSTGEHDISDYVVNVNPHFSRRMREVTTLNHTHEQASPGLLITSLDLELVYSEDATIGTDIVLGALLEDTTVRAWKYYPRGTGGKLYSGSGFVENYQPVSRVGDTVMATCTIRSNSRTRT